MCRLVPGPARTGVVVTSRPVMSRAVERLGAEPDRVAWERSLDTRDGEDVRPDSDGHASPAPVLPRPPPLPTAHVSGLDRRHLKQADRFDPAASWTSAEGESNDRAGGGRGPRG